MFKSDQICEFLAKNNHKIRKCLTDLNLLNFRECNNMLAEISNLIDEMCLNNSMGDELFLNEAYILSTQLSLISNYGKCWELIVNGKYPDSWNSLQNTLDDLVTIKRYFDGDISRLISHIELQFTELEELYPYRIFASIGAVIDKVECSICGKDIDSFECLHEKGVLYGGKIAYGIAKGISEIDHVALVENPEDKRCVIQYEDDSEQFKAIQYLSNLLKEKKLSPLGFSNLEHKKIKELNPKYKYFNRNEKCYCGSGKKFKKCCISKKYNERNHIEIIGRYVTLSDSFPEVT